ncbi:hypothetical protein C5167_016597 [Papaver somniferum]|nr:hypothetical protein C5167_016597 [Papaver somniferum]
MSNTRGYFLPHISRETITETSLFVAILELEGYRKKKKKMEEMVKNKKLPRKSVVCCDGRRKMVAEMQELYVDEKTARSRGFGFVNLRNQQGSVLNDARQTPGFCLLHRRSVSKSFTKNVFNYSTIQSGSFMILRVFISSFTQYQLSTLFI